MDLDREHMRCQRGSVNFDVQLARAPSKLVLDGDDLRVSGAGNKTNVQCVRRLQNEPEAHVQLRAGGHGGTGGL
jgi:hypothetical protein